MNESFIEASSLKIQNLKLKYSDLVQIFKDFVPQVWNDTSVSSAWSGKKKCRYSPDPPPPPFNYLY